MIPKRIADILARVESAECNAADAAELRRYIAALITTLEPLTSGDDLDFGTYE